MPSSLWKNRVPSDDDGTEKIRKLPRGENAADRNPPKGYVKGIVKAEEANTEEQQAMDALTRKLSGKSSGKLTREELRLAKKMNMEVKPSGSLVTGKDAPSKHKGGVVKGSKAKARNQTKKKVEDAVESVKKPFRLFK